LDDLRPPWGVQDGTPLVGGGPRKPLEFTVEGEARGVERGRILFDMHFFIMLMAAKLVGAGLATIALAGAAIGVG